MKSDAKREEVLKYIRQGSTNKSACILAGIEESTLYRWVNGSASFASRLKKAQEHTKKLAENTIQLAFGKSWQAAAWWLERKHNAEYGQRVKQELSGDRDNPVVVSNSYDLSKLSVDERKQLKKLTQKLNGTITE